MEPKHVDIRLIRQAQALAEHGSISRAAEALGIAQPTLSRSVKDLERRVGLPLFTRHQFGVKPTDFGRVFLERAARVANEVADLEHEIALAKGIHSGELALGFGPYAAEALGPQLLRGFTSAHRDVQLRVDVDAPDHLERKLRNRELDLVVAESSMVDDADGIDIVADLPPLPAYAFARAGHPLTRESGVAVADVLSFPFVQIARMPPRVLKPLLEQRKARPPFAGVAAYPPFPAIECPNFSLAVAATGTSDCVMFATLSMVEEALKARTLVPVFQAPWLRSNWSIMRLQGRALDAVATALVARLQDIHRGVVRHETALRRAWDKH